jgi:hypothetical protein
MAAAIQILRSVTPGSRPSGRQYGEPYVNLGDNQFGIFDSSNVARDLLGVPMFSASLSYIKGAAVNYQGKLYISNQAISAAAFNPAQWNSNFLFFDLTASLISGYTATPTNGGTITGANQTYTPTPGTLVQNLQYITLNGSSLTGNFTFAPPAADSTVIVDVINGGTGAVAATLVTSGFTKVTGDTWANTNGNIFRFFASRIAGRSLLQIQAMQ